MDSVPAAVEAIEGAWEHQSFRSALTALVSLQASHLRALRELTDETPLIPIYEASAQLSVSADDLEDANRAFTFLYRVARQTDASPADLAAAIKQRVEDQLNGVDLTDDQEQALAELLEVRPAYERSAAAQAPLATLIGSFSSIGLHVVDNDELEPMIFIRLYFDEAPQGGSGEVIAFQMPQDAAEELLAKISSGVARITALSERLTATPPRYMMAVDWNAVGGIFTGVGGVLSLMAAGVGAASNRGASTRRQELKELAGTLKEDFRETRDEIARSRDTLADQTGVLRLVEATLESNARYLELIAGRIPDRIDQLGLRIDRLVDR